MKKSAPPPFAYFAYFTCQLPIFTNLQKLSTSPNHLSKKKTPLRQDEINRSQSVVSLSLSLSLPIVEKPSSKRSFHLTQMRPEHEKGYDGVLRSIDKWV